MMYQQQNLLQPGLLNTPQQLYQNPNSLQLQNAQNDFNVIQAVTDQTQQILSTQGRWVAYAPSGTADATKVITAG